MKTPDEIKNGLKCCVVKARGATVKDCDIDCPYRPEGVFCKNALHKDTLDYIQQLEAGIDHAEKVARECAKSITENLDKLQAKLIQVERERDAAVNDLKIAEDCYNCGHNYACKHDGNGYRKCSECGECPCSECNSGRSQYEWRGVCAENTKEQKA